MTMLKPMKYNNTYALAVKRDFAKQHNIRTIGDLNKVKDQLKPGFTLNLMIVQMVTKLFKRLII